MTHATLPDLWLRARDFYQSVHDQFGPARDLAERRFDSRAYKGLFLAWLIPVEKLVRGLLTVGALTHLLMTEEGRKLRQTSIKMKVPTCKPPPAPAPPAAPSRLITVPTIYRPLITPPPEPPRPINAAKTNAADWRVAFKVLRWDLPPPETPRPKAAPQKKKPPRLMLLSNDPYELALSEQRAHTERLAREKRDAARRAVAHVPSQALANRFEALRRVIANPAPHILRLAKLIARIPHGMLDDEPPKRTVRGWELAHGWPELVIIHGYCCLAIEMLNLSG